MTGAAMPRPHVVTGARPACAGFSLIESLLSLALLMTAMAGLMQAQASALSTSHAAWQQQEAALLLRDLLGRWQLNREAAASYVAALQAPLDAIAGPDACLSYPCAPVPRAYADVAALADSLRQRLPQPHWLLEPCLDHPGHCLLLAWGGTEASSGPDGGCLDASGQRHVHARCLVVVLP